MPGLHSAFSRHLFTLSGNVLKSGGAKNLAKGQFAIVKSDEPTANGAKVISDFAGLPSSTIFEMRLGKARTPNVRTAMNGKAYSSETFTVNDIVSITANAPKVSKRTFDEYLVGFDGINPKTAINLLEGQTTVLDIVLSGDHVGFITGECEYVIKMHFGREIGETNQEAIERLYNRLKKETFPQGVNITEVLDIKVVNSENTSLSGVPYVFSSLVLTDEGDSNAFAEVQAQYPNNKVEVTSRVGLKTTYTILHPLSVSLANYVTSIASYVKGCEDCAPGYSALGSGVIYSVQIEDDGADVTTTVDDLPGFVAGTVVKVGQVAGVGSYTVVLSADLTDAQIATYVATAGIKTSAIIKRVGLVMELCVNGVTTSTAWVNGQVCEASVELYKIQLKDSDCNGNILAELQAAYPDLVIESGLPTGRSTQKVTLTGTSGTGNIKVGAVNYLATFATDATTTASNFVTANAAAILAAEGLVVTSALGVLSFNGLSVGFPTITFTNVTLTLAGAVSVVDILTTAVTGGCQTVYSTSVITNIVCQECSNIFLDNYTSVAPVSYGFIEWDLVKSPKSETALMGLKLKGKPFDMIPTEATRDTIPFFETSTKIGIAGGYIEETSLSFDPHFNDIFNVKLLNRAQDRDNLGAKLMSWEDASRYYFDGEVRHENNLFAKAALGEESVLEFSEQYVCYGITIHDSKYSQGRGGRSDMGTTYNVWSPIGRAGELESLVNKLAVKAGLPTVSALVKK